MSRPPGTILVLVSVDGWRWDYFDRASTPTLHALAARGVRAEGLIPSFPSKTYPNHYTIVTGLYPAHHGIVSNNMWDDAIGERFTMSAPTSKDTRWWGGEPLWATAVKQGQRAASMFWPGSEVEIGGVRPTAWKPFDDDFPNDVARQAGAGLAGAAGGAAARRSSRCTSATWTRSDTITALTAGRRSTWRRGSTRCWGAWSPASTPAA